MDDLSSFVNHAIMFALVLVGALLISVYSALSGAQRFEQDSPTSSRWRDVLSYRYIRDREHRKQEYVDRHLAALSKSARRNVHILSVSSLLWIAFICLLIPLSPIEFEWWPALTGAVVGTVPPYLVFDLGRRRGRVSSDTNTQSRQEPGPMASA